MRKSNKKGFTLIELLAVIVILGIIMAIAIPSMTQYIANSRKDTMLSTAQEFISAARTMLISENELPNIGETKVIPVTSLDMNSGGVSPYTNKEFSLEEGRSYVLVYNNGTGTDGKTTYSYAIALDDGNGNCLSTVSEKYLSTSSTRTKRGQVGATCGYITPIKETTGTLSGSNENLIQVIKSDDNEEFPKGTRPADSSGNYTLKVTYYK